MKQIFIICSLFIFITGVNSVIAKEWYEGGTLHKATMREFLCATQDNRMATISDMVAYVTESTGNKKVNFRELKRNTKDVVGCMSIGTIGIDIAEDMSVSHVALTCMILLQEQNPGKYPWNIKF